MKSYQTNRFINSEEYMKNLGANQMFFSNFFEKRKKRKRKPNQQWMEELFELVSNYRDELQDYSLSIESFNTIVKYNGGLINVLKKYVLVEGIGDGVRMCSMTFPSIFEEWEKDVDPDYFESGVRFTMTIDNWAQVISDQEFVWLIEDTCEMHLASNPDDATEIYELLNKVREKFNK